MLSGGRSARAPQLNKPPARLPQKKASPNELGLLDAEEALLPARAAGETADPPVRRKHPVARNDDRDRVGAAGGADGPRRARLGQAPGDLAVRAGLARRNVEQLRPDGSLEIGAGGEVKRRQAARRLAKETGSEPPPKHILNAPTKLMEEQGYGKGYDYDHNAEDGFSGQNYFPDGVKRPVLYQPVERGFERELRKRTEFFAKKRIQRQGE